MNELHRTKKKYGLGSACIGGGQGKTRLEIKIFYFVSLLIDH